MSVHMKTMVPNAIIEEMPEEADEPWMCDIRYSGTEEPCPEKAQWLGVFKCGCIHPSCEEHRKAYMDALWRIQREGRCRVKCSDHGPFHLRVRDVVSWILIP